MAAGLAAQSAEADFSFTYSYVLAGAYDYGGFGPYFDAFAGAGTWSVLAEDSSGGDFAAGASTSTPLGADRFGLMLVMWCPRPHRGWRWGLLMR